MVDERDRTGWVMAPVAIVSPLLPILPLLISEFDLSYTRAGLLVTVFFSMYATLQLPAGAVADRLGQSRLITVGMAVMGTGMTLASVAPSYPVLLGGVALSGAGGSTYHPAGMSLISDIEGAETEGKAMGIHELAGMFGNMLAPVLIGGLAVVTDWRIALGVTAGVGLLYAGAFALLMEPLSSVDTPSATTTTSQSGSAERRGFKRLLTDVWEVTRIPLAWWVLGLFLAKLLFTLQSYGVRTYFTSYVVARTGLSTGIANGMFFLFLAGSALSTVGFGALADRFDRLDLLTATFLGAGGFIVATAFVPTSAVVLFGWFFLLGVAVYASLPVVNTLASEYSEREFSGSLFGIVQTASGLGGAISPVLFGALASRIGVQSMFPLIAVTCFVAGLGFLVTGRCLGEPVQRRKEKDGDGG
ncbi:MFS transporter [Halorubrum sp. F4]|uniref:MFS transporter n=1 Tax=Halorubrum sp. F4 TaxID=2989715 RepID=UPI00247FFEBC|nr:MFS transporter [Halorubrum sp. F4]